MKFLDGEVVVDIEKEIHMTIFNYKNKYYKCVWFIGNKLNYGYFEEDNLMLLDEWNRFVIQKNRDNKINDILN